MSKQKIPLGSGSAAPQRPVATQRTTAAPKAGPETVQMNKAAAMMQQVKVLKLTVEDWRRETSTSES